MVQINLASLGISDYLDQHWLKKQQQSLWYKILIFNLFGNRVSWDVDVTRKYGEKESVVEVMWSKEVVRVGHVSEDCLKVILELGLEESEWVDQQRDR